MPHTNHTPSGNANIPDTIAGRYKLEKEIGRGGNAIVYKGHDPKLGRGVAVKVLPSEFMHNQEFKDYFKKEIKLMALLSHPGIVPIYDKGEENGQPYLVMPLYEGSLANRLKSQPRLTLNEVIKIIGAIAPALDAMHAHKPHPIVHRDLKPANILYDAHGNYFIADLGIAKVLQNTSMSLGKTPLGTPSYMSPEQIQGHQLTGASDIYSLGIMVFEMLAGHPPYQSDEPVGLSYHHVHSPVPSLHKERPDLSQGVDKVIQKVLAKNLEDRHQTASEFVQALQSVLHPQERHYLTPPWLKPLAPLAPLALLLLTLCPLATTTLRPLLFATPTATRTDASATPSASNTMIVPTKTAIPTQTLIPTIPCSPPCLSPTATRTDASATPSASNTMIVPTKTAIPTQTLIPPTWTPSPTFWPTPTAKPSLVPTNIPARFQTPVRQPTWTPVPTPLPTWTPAPPPPTWTPVPAPPPSVGTPLAPVRAIAPDGGGKDVTRPAIFEWSYEGNLPEGYTFMLVAVRDGAEYSLYTGTGKKVEGSAPAGPGIYTWYVKIIDRSGNEQTRSNALEFSWADPNGPSGHIVQ